jgi:DNA-binding NarL/FixJ family response regulator
MSYLPQLVCDMTIKVLLGCNFPLLCEGFQSLFQQEGDLEVVAMGTTGKEVREKVQECMPDVVLMDIALNGDHSGVVDWIRKAHPQVKIVAWSHQRPPEYALRILQAGASGILINDFHFQEVVQAIRQVVSNQVYLNPIAAKSLVEKLQEFPEKLPLDHSELTDREREVLVLLVRGCKNAQIAEQLGIKPKTLETHRSNLMKKLGLKTVAELTRYAMEKGIIS